MKTRFLTRFVSAAMAVCMLVLAFGTVTFAAAPAADSADMYLIGISTWTDGTYTAADILEMSGGLIEGTSDATYTMASGALTITTTKAGTIYFNLGNSAALDDNYGKAVFKLSIKQDETADASDANIWAYGDAERTAGFASNAGKITGINKDGTFHHGSVTYNQRLKTANYGAVDKDADDWAEIRIELEKIADSTYGDYWKAAVYSEETGYEDTLIQGGKFPVTLNDAATAKDWNQTLSNVLKGIAFKANGVYGLTIKDVQMYLDRPTATNCSESVAYESGTANITFEEEIDSTTVGGITVADASGNNVTVASASASGTTASLTFGELAEGATYTVTIPEKTVKTTAGVWVADKTFTFTTTSQAEADRYLITDFSDWGAAGEAVTLTADQVTELSGGVIEGNSAHTYARNADNSFTINIPSGGASYFNFGKALDFNKCEGKVVFEMDLNETDLISASGSDMGIVAYDDATRNANFTNSGTNHYAHNGIVAKVNISGQVANKTVDYNQRYNQTAAKDYSGTDEWISMRIELEKVWYKDTLMWRALAYSTESETETIICGGYYPTENPSVITSDSYDVLSTIVRGFAFKSDGGAKKVTLKNVKLYLDRPEAVSCSTTAVTDGGSIDITFENDVDAATLSGITVKDASGNTVDILSTSASGTVATLNLDSLTAGNTYTVNIPKNSVKTATEIYVKNNSFTFDAVEAEPLFSADFTDTTKWGAVGTTYSTTELEAKDAQLTVKAGTLQTYTVSADGLTFTPYVDTSASGSSTETFNINLGTTVETGTVAAELEIKVEAAPTTLNRDIKFWGDSDPLNAARLSSSGDGVSISGANNWVHVIGSASETAIPAVQTGDDTAKFIKLRLVASRASAAERWNYVIYDMNDNNKPLCISMSNNLKQSVLETTSISAIGFSVWRDATARKSKTGNITLKNAKVYMMNDSAAALGGEVINDSSTDTELTISGNTVTFTGTIYSRGKNQAANKLILAGYDADGDMIGATVTDVNGVMLYTADAPLTVTFDEAVSSAKLMIFNNFDAVTPLIDTLDADTSAVEP